MLTVDKILIKGLKSPNRQTPTINHQATAQEIPLLLVGIFPGGRPNFLTIPTPRSSQIYFDIQTEPTPPNSHQWRSQNKILPIVHRSYQVLHQQIDGFLESIVRM